MKLNLSIALLLFITLQAYPQIKKTIQSQEQEFNSRKLITHKILDNGFRIAQTINQEWINSEWNNISRSSYLYDADNISTYALNEVWDTNQWVNDTKLIYVYDANGNTTEEITQRWIDPGWENSTKIIYEYDGNLNTTSETSQMWEATIWVNTEMNQYEFTNNKLTGKLSRKWNGTSWLNKDRYKYTYAADNLLEELYQTWDNEWINSTIVINSYDIQNNRIESLNKYWKENEWLLEFRFSSEYSNSNRTTVTLQEGWVGTIWSNVGLYTQIYNNNNLLIGYTSQYWHSIDGWINQQHWDLSYTEDNKQSDWVTQFWKSTFWENYSRLKSVYDINGNQIVYAWEMWENSGWTNHIQLLMIYDPVTSIDNRKNTPHHFSMEQNCPNPFTKTTTITWQQPKDSHIVIKVYDFKGREVKTIVNYEQSKGEHQVTFNASGLPAGVYFYQLRAGGIVETMKMIHLK